MLELIKSVFKSAVRGIKNDPLLKKLKNKYPRFFNWLSNRFDRSYKFGLFLTIGFIFFALFLFLFLGVIQDIVAKDPLAFADQRVTNLFVLFRTQSFSRLMLYFTYLGEWKIVVLGTVFLSIILIFLDKIKYFYSLLISVVGGQILINILKNIISRQRPSIANAIISETNFSFPSGHTFVVFSFYLLSFFIIWRLVNRRAFKIILIFLGCLLLFMIPVSRIYLGVHWSSDILGTIFLGSAWLTIFITYLVINDCFQSNAIKKRINYKNLKYLSLIFLILWIGLTFIYYKTNSYEKVVSSKTVKLNTTAIDLVGIPDNIFQNLPRTSEGITGNIMEPINFIFIGSKGQLDSAFKSAGWVSTDPINISTSWRIGYSTLFDKPYQTAPGAPSYWDFRPNDFAYEKPTSSAREREHIHIWATPFVVDGQALWLGTAHYDMSVKLTTKFIPTHEIDPFIDKERDSLNQQLLNTNTVSSIREVRIVSPEIGKNQAGSVFVTDGKGYLIILK